QQTLDLRLSEWPRAAQVRRQLPLGAELFELQVDRILERDVGCRADGGRVRGEEQPEEPRDAAGRAGHGAVRSDESRKRSYLRTNGHQIASAMPRLTTCSTTARTSPPELR